MNASFIRERQRYTSVVTAGPLSTHHIILFAIPVWKNIFSSAGRLKIKNDLRPVMPKISADKEVHKNLVCGETFQISPNSLSSPPHLTSGYTHTPQPLLLSCGHLKVSLSQVVGIEAL